MVVMFSGLASATAVANLAYVLIGLLIAAGGWLRWIRPRWRRLSARGNAAFDAVVGREAIIHPETGREIVPATPGIGTRMAKVEETVERLSTVLESLNDAHTRLDAVEGRVTSLEQGRLERIVTKAESAAAWRAVAAAQDAPPPDPAPTDS